VVGEKPVCISKWIDPMLQGLYSKIGLCEPISSFNYTNDANGDPLITDCQKTSFYKYYETSNSIVAFESLYKNKDNLRDKFIAYWDKTSARFANNPYVTGFDPLNEPFPGNFLRDPKLLMPGRADREQLAPMYAKIQAKYMTNSNGTSKMWFEPMSFPDEIGNPIGDGNLGGVVFPVGFEVPPGGQIGSPNHILNDHTYCCQLSPSMCATGEPKTTKY
jgi:hypothetical protein